MDKEIVTEHFATSWATPQTDFREVEQRTSFTLEPKITENEQEEMVGFMLNDRNIEEVIKSRHDLSASGIDGIGSRIIKSAGKESSSSNGSSGYGSSMARSSKRGKKHGQF
jgi:hypothetical protein